MNLDFGKAEFIRSAAAPEQFLRDGFPQFAFAGRSNVGKSSVINRLLGRKNMAYVGAAPGKTTQINYFLVSRKAYLVDLPGYGYAKVSRTEKERWGQLMESYFQEERNLITVGVLIVDIRHKPTADDVIMHNWFRETGCPEIVVANKLDKLKKSEVEPALSLIRQTLELDTEETLLPFSAEKGVGREELIRLLDEACAR
ncbi:ribosome biogenesis GTP-binding protein YihA/YsxC [Oscillibacter sp.]|uniref:ribosome biogenesis GTP-binding protein YihA/YsxC n=1 Tax=Oscillibacter sp. TaxID=1945593 RepID=UPI0026293CF3|nr:ribosome biogenesis GTP-binding protein YihA/YsxC [Oscillibacter sp.]MDD3347156.1 ribosome biogenesis GTP-binding protein YihA/YsxC [Oscillibacter sp.]